MVSKAQQHPSLSLTQKLLVGLLRLYKLTLSPYIGNQCRFHPTCSCYARQAIIAHGSLRGSVLATKRLLRCHPWHDGGVDPVPERIQPTQSTR